VWIEIIPKPPSKGSGDLTGTMILTCPLCGCVNTPNEKYINIKNENKIECYNCHVIFGCTFELLATTYELDA
jgi:hypothetical protein